MTRLPVTHYIKNLKLIERNREWLGSSGITTKEKLSYYAHITLSYAVRRKQINYLGQPLFYDNPATPLNLQNYPHEITSKILANMHKKPKTVLDIGGNLGQFSITMDHVLGNSAKIDSFEPNTFIHEYLVKNTSKRPSIKSFNYGLGEEEGTVVLHFNPDRTGIGSVIKENAGDGAVMKQRIQVTASPEKLTGRKHYDLIKIDVEGFEYHALRGLKGMSCEYLFIELSGQGRKKDYLHSEMMELLNDLWGEFDIQYTTAFSARSDTFDMLIRFKKTPKSKR